VAGAATPAVRKSVIQAKHLMFVVYGLLIIVVYLTRDRLLLDSNSWLRQRYAPLSGLMLLHGIPGAIALFIGVFQCIAMQVSWEFACAATQKAAALAKL